MIENSACCVVETGSIIAREENGKAFRISNKRNRRIQVCRVDDCLISGNHSKKCDFLFLLDVENTQKIVLVELKGNDHIRAIEQLVSAAEQLNLKKRGVPIESYIIGSPSPKIQTKYQKEILRMSSRYKMACVAFPIRKNDKLTIDWE